MVHRTSIGMRPNGTHGIRISKPGADVANYAVPPLLDSDYKYLQILFGGYVAISTTVSSEDQGGIPPYLQVMYTWQFTGQFLFPYALPFAPASYVSVRYSDRDKPMAFHLPQMTPVVVTPYANRLVFEGLMFQIVTLNIETGDIVGADALNPNPVGAYVSILNVPGV